MPIRKRADRFQVRVSLGAGRRVEQTLPAGARRADAIALEATLRRAVIDQVVGRPRRFTIADALDRWETDARALRSWQKDLRFRAAVVRQLAGSRPLDELPALADDTRRRGLAAKSSVRLWTEARKAARMPGVRLHDLRHYFGSLLVQRGADAATVRDLTGHSDFEVRSRRTGGGSARGAWSERRAKAAGQTWVREFDQK